MTAREKFIEATGREPQDDDLERVNCKQAGEIGHMCCGWDDVDDKPEFETMRRAKHLSENRPS